MKKARGEVETKERERMEEADKKREKKGEM